MFKKYKNQDLDMPFWWKRNPKTSDDYVKTIIEQLNKIQSVTSLDTKKKLQEDCSNYLMGVKHFILGDTEPKLTTETMDQLYMDILNSDLIYELLTHFGDLEFEARKEVVLIFAICLSYSKDNKFVAVDYFVSRPKTINYLLVLMENTLRMKVSPQDVFLLVGNMIMNSIKYEQLCRIILKDPQFWQFFNFANISNFEISTESLQIISSALTQHPKLTSREFFVHESNTSKFIQCINKLIANGSYVTKRQCTKLLGSLILLRSNHQLMQSYINSPDNLKLIMTLLTDKSKNLQLEAFNVFKVMIANPRKNKQIFDILAKNREKLLKYFEKFGLDNQESSFINEKEFIVQQIEALPRIVSTNNTDTLSSSPLS